MLGRSEEDPLKKTALLSAIIILLPLLSPAGDEVSVPALPEPVPGAPAIDGDTLVLDLSDAYVLALQRNLDLQIGRYDLAIAGDGILAQTGVFDPSLDFSVSGDSTQSPSATQLEGAEVSVSRSATFSLALTQLLPTGTQVSVEAGSRRSETNSQFYFLNPYWGSSFNLSLTQPLLEGFGTTVNRSAIIIAKNNRDQTTAAFEQLVVGTLLDVENAYWDLVAARWEIQVKEQSLELAERLLSETKERVRVGTSAPIDTVQSESTAAARRQELITARISAANAEDTLKAVLGFDEPDEWMTPIETTEKLPLDPIPTALGSSIETALARRPELRQQKLSIGALEQNMLLARNALLPRLDLQARYGWSGVGGTSLLLDENGDPVVDPDTGKPLKVAGGIGDSWTQIGNFDYPGWSLGLMLSMPIGNNQAKGELAQRRYYVEQGKTRLRALEQQIILEVRRAVRTVEDGVAAIDAAEAARHFAERNLEAEQTKFQNGLSTNYQVSKIQEDLALAQLTEINARTIYRKAIAGLHYATGTLLESHDVKITDPGQDEVPHDYWKDVKWMQFVDFHRAEPEATE
jgi:outer membrane protein